MLWRDIKRNKACYGMIAPFMIFFILDIKRNKACYGMIAPFMIFFILFTAVPVLMSLPMGFTDFNMAQPPKYVGLSNFTTLFLSDKIFMKSIRVTIVFALFTGPISYVLCFLLAWLINEMHSKLKTVFTLIFYIPSMANVYTVWQLIFSGDMNGYMNSFLINLGIISAPVQWLTDGRYAIEGISNRWQELRYIVIPSMGPQLMFAAVMQIVSSFTAGTVAQNLVGFPSTDYKAHTIMTHAFDYGWQRFEMGYASAICMVLFIAMFLCNKLISKVLGKYMD